MKNSLLALLSVPLFAIASDDDRLPHQKDWPQEAVVTVGDVRTRIDGPKLWTMSGLEFQNQVAATEDSAYGTVVTIRDVGHLGSAHFLLIPDKPGEVEKENVLSLKFFLDDKPVTKFTPQMDLNGKSFRMERESKIRGLDLKSTISLQDDIVIETERWHVTKPMDLRVSYPLMCAWAPSATHYAFGNDSGLQRDGVFRKEGKSDDGGLEKNSRWMAVFNAETGMGGVFYLLQHPDNVDTWLQWTDAPGIYRKLRIMTLVEKVVPEGFSGTYQSAVGFFTATEANWKERATQRAAEVAAYGKKHAGR